MPSSLGQELNRAREERGMTLHDIAASTHIGVRFLQAIEGDDYKILPGGVFNRAFVRKFAKQVGYDEEQAIKLYDEQLEIQGIEPQKRYQLGVEDFESKSSSGNGLLFSLLALILLIAGAYVAYVLLNPPAPSQPANRIVDASPTPEATATPDALAATTSPTPAALPDASPGASPAGSPTPVVVPPGAMRMQLIASGGQCWISLKADGAPTEQILLNDGDNREFAVNERVIFNSLGNYPAVRISINGRLLNFSKLFPNQKGVVAKNVVITKDNYQQFLD
jgi:cytoskeletal protein RodZ